MICIESPQSIHQLERTRPPLRNRHRSLAPASDFPLIEWIASELQHTCDCDRSAALCDAGRILHEAFDAITHDAIKTVQ